MSKSVLITGAAGFIGSSLAEHLLHQGYQVTGIDNFDSFYDKSIKQKNIQSFGNNERFRFYEGDIRDAEFLNSIKEPIDLVVHLAAKAGVIPSIKFPEEYMSVNITGTYQILEFMKNRGIKKMVFASSSSIYGNNKKIPFQESDNVDFPISPYAFTKKSCELMNYNYHHLYKMDILNLRFFTVYGPKQRPDLAIHKFVKLIDQGKSIEMYGDGSSARDYTYVDDIVSGITAAMNYVMTHESVYEIINIGNNSPVKIKELISTIYALMNKEENIKVMPMQPGDVDITYADVSKANRLLGYKPSVTLREGLTKFINWYKSQS